MNDRRWIMDHGPWSADHRSQQIRPAARRMHLLARRLVRWAHDTRVFATNALTIALLDRNIHAAVARKRKICLPDMCPVLRAIAQVHIHLLRIEDLAGVENAIWIGGLL